MVKHEEVALVGKLVLLNQLVTGDEIKVWMGTFVRTFVTMDVVAKWEKDNDHGNDIFTAEQFVVAHYCPVRVEDKINDVVPQNF